MNYDYITNLLILHYIILLYYIILLLALILLITYSLFKGSNDKVKFERFRLWQLVNCRREADGGGGKTI